jgi:acyl transferase domain-containing protein
MNSDDMLEGIAVVGMAGRFPAAGSVDEFWQNLVSGRECSTEYTIEQLIARGLPRRIAEAPNYVRRCPVVDVPEIADLGAFGMTRSEAQSLDPQVRMLLICCREAVLHAGYDPKTFDGLTGLWAGSAFSDWALKRVLSGLDPSETSAALASINILRPDDLISTLARGLGLNGPALRVQTACSTSLVAIHTACSSLRNYQCDLALAGGVSLQYHHVPGYLYVDGEIFSPDGRCRAFDQRANGTVLGEGCAVVALRRLGDAVAAGDSILAVILGSAVNNDGDNRPGYTAPGVAGQSELIATALSTAGISPNDVSYVEAHGTGTSLGDPIEVTALAKAFRGGTQEYRVCGLGSVKTNIGHLDVAAGATGFIKTVCSLKHRQLVPTLHFETPNSQLKLDTTPFFVVDKLTEWKPRNGRRTAGVSSFGLGGTNCHIIVEEFQGTGRIEASGGPLV